MATTMLLKSSLLKGFWAKVVNTTCYIQNHVFLTPIFKMTPYELWKGRKPNISYFHIFGSKCYILNTKDKLSKFDPKFDLGVSLGYSSMSKSLQGLQREDSDCRRNHSHILQGKEERY